jgi:predicted short-subunit dehydrogenase-like oxidoreductase (DUF2520 family)
VTAPSVFFIGAGRLGSALARGLAESGWDVAGYARSARGRAQLRRIRVPPLPLADAGAFDLVFLAVPDTEVSAAAREVERHLVRGQVVAHGAGALPLDPLAVARRRGAHVGSLHPMQAFAGGGVTPGVTAALDGDPVALRVLSRAAADLGLSTVRVPERGRVLYHAASAIAANLCMALADLAVETWTASGAPRRRALDALVPLMRGAVENLADRGLPAALTGPASRGDAGVVARQLRALRGESAEVYRLLSLRLVTLAERGGLDAQKAATVRRALRRRSGRSARGRGRRP